MGEDWLSVVVIAQLVAITSPPVISAVSVVSRRPRLVIIPLVVLAIWAVIGVRLVAYASIGRLGLLGIGWSAAFSLSLGVLALCVGGIVVASKSRRDLRKVGANVLFYLFSSLGLLALSLQPYQGMGIATECDRRNRETGRIIVAALEAYREETGAYPETLSSLLPDYLEELPSPWCDDTATREAEFKLVICSEDIVLLTVHRVGDWFEVYRYNLISSQWSSISPMDVGICYDAK